MIALLALQSPAAPDVIAGAPWHWVAILLAVLGEVLAVVFVMRVLARGGAPASTLLWMAVILAAPWLGLCLYYLLPRRIQLRRLRRRQDKLAWIEGELDRLRSGDATPQPKGEGVCRLLHSIDPDGVHEGNRVRWLPTGPGFLAAVEQAIAGARDFVHMEMYIFRPDAAGRLVLDRLREAAARGVAVRLLYDGFGSWGLGSADLAPLRAAGGRAEPYLPLLWKRRPFTLNLRNHRKLLVVDGQTAFLGGRNVGDEYLVDRLPSGRPWLDSMVQVDGPAVGRLHRVFVEDWYNAVEEDLIDARYFPEVAAAGEDRVGVLLSGPDLSVNGLWWVGFDLINNARQSIDLSSPYLVPPPTMLFALKVAAARGVAVRIYTNGPDAEQFVLYHAQRSYYRELLEAGIAVHETERRYNHGKFMVVDGSTLLIGSANLDMRSAHWNFELGVVVPDGAAAGDALRTLQARIAESRRVGEADLPEGSLRRVLDGLCRLGSPLL